MPKSCSVRACKSRVRRGVYLNRFFQFPSDPERRRLWASRCGNGDAWLPSSKHVYVCADHFVTGEPLNKRGHPDYAPSLLLVVDEIGKQRDTNPATESLTRPKVSESNREIIKYDEYFEGGIPESLLEGLGFSENDKPAEDDDDDEEHEMNTLTTHGDEAPFGQTQLGHADIAKMLQFGLMTGLILPAPVFFPSQAASINNGVANHPAVQPQNEVLNLTISQHWNKPSHSNFASDALSHVEHPLTSSMDLGKNNGAFESASAGIAKSPPVNRAKRVSSVASNPTSRLEASQTNSISRSNPQSTPSTCGPSDLSDCRSLQTRQITKGNIMYERLLTGEVIASVIKKTDVQDLSSKVDIKSKRMPPRAVQPQGIRNNQISISNLEQCPSEYPVNAHNIMDVLEHSIQATHSMRLLLMSLRDDLRRTGGSNAVIVTEEQARKRREVAVKLASAYVTYKESIDNIENARFPNSGLVETKALNLESAVKSTVSTASNNSTVENCSSSARNSGITNIVNRADRVEDIDYRSSKNPVSSSLHGDGRRKRVGGGSSKNASYPTVGESGKELQRSKSRTDGCGDSPVNLHIDET